MNWLRIHTIAKYIFCLVLFGAAVSELLHSEVVTKSMDAIGITRRLLYLLAFFKIAGVLTLLFSSSKRAVEWAYAGFFFNLVGATYLLVTAGHVILPDVVVAPTYLVLWLFTYLSHRRATETVALAAASLE